MGADLLVNQTGRLSGYLCTCLHGAFMTREVVCGGGGGVVWDTWQGRTRISGGRGIHICKYMDIITVKKDMILYNMVPTSPFYPTPTTDGCFPW